MGKHTPGPWDRVGTLVYVLNEDGFNRFCALVQDAHTAKQELEANARLIAAAPELLEALQECIAALGRCVEQGGGPDCEHESGTVCFCKENKAISLARDAIAKAKGGRK